jgi:hypothetical protein
VVEGEKLASLHQERLQAGFRRATMVVVWFGLLRGGLCQLCVLCIVLVLFMGIVTNSCSILIPNVEARHTLKKMLVNCVTYIF